LFDLCDGFVGSYSPYPNHLAQTRVGCHPFGWWSVVAVAVVAVVLFACDNIPGRCGLRPVRCTIETAYSMAALVDAGSNSQSNTYNTHKTKQTTKYQHQHLTTKGAKTG
jgi:hypothetical protein